MSAPSVIASTPKAIDRIIHMKPFEGLLLTKDYYHAVTPMGAARGEEMGYRDILLTTIEEHDSTIRLKNEAFLTL